MYLLYAVGVVDLYYKWGDVGMGAYGKDVIV